MLTWNCRQCGEHLEAPESLRGQQMNCPACGTVSRIGPIHIEPQSSIPRVAVVVASIAILAALLAVGVVARELLQERRIVRETEPTAIEPHTPTMLGATPSVQDSPVRTDPGPGEITLTFVDEPDALEPWGVAYTNRPVTRAEAQRLGDEAHEHYNLESTAIFIYFDETSAKRHGRVRLAPLLYQSGQRITGIGAAPESERLQEWYEVSSLFVSHHSYDAGVLRFRLNTFDDITFESVPEIWYLLEIVLGSTSTVGVARIFYDLDRVECDIYRGDELIGTFRASGFAIRHAAWQGGVWADESIGDLSDAYYRLEDRRKIAAISDEDFHLAVHNLAVRKMKHYENWMTTMARAGATLEVENSIPRSVRFGFVPF